MNRVKAHRARLPAAVLVGALTLAACGGTATKHQAKPKPVDNGVAAKTADEIFHASKDALRGASSVRVTGKTLEEGRTTELDLRLGKAGAQGTIKMDGSTLELLSVNGRLYLRGREFWRESGNQQLATLIGDRWVLAPASGSGAKAFTPFKELTDIGSWADQLVPEGTISKGQTGTVNGQPAIALKDTDGSSLWVATTGPPYPLRVEPKPGAPDPENLDLREYNAPLNLTAPADALDLEKLSTGG